LTTNIGNKKKVYIKCLCDNINLNLAHNLEILKFFKNEDDRETKHVIYKSEEEKTTTIKYLQNYSTAIENINL
jgi:hypothetical protein